MKITKLKVIAIILIITLIIPNFAFAAVTYTREGGNNITGIATYITDDTYVDSKYDAKSINVPLSNIEIYDYNSTTLKQPTGNGDEIAYSGNENKYYYSIEEAVGGSNEFLNYTIKLGTGEQHEENVATFIYKNALKINGMTYNVKVNLKDIYKEGENEQALRVRIGNRVKQENNLYDVSTYTSNIGIVIGVPSCTGNKLEVKTEYFAIDNDGNSIDISGLLGITDIDLNQGVFIKNFVANNNNIYMYEKNSNNETIEDINYKTVEDGTYIYSTVDTNTSEHDVYALIDEKNEIGLTFTFDDKSAGSAIKFYGNDESVKIYKKITTSVTGGTITPSITNIKNGENKTISYTPNDSSRQYLKSITVDGTTLTDEQMQTYQNEYAFTNITEDHTIEVVYANKPAVSFNPMGGSPTPDTQYVDLEDKATEPETEPTKEGYTFDGWQNPDGTTPYDFDTPVTEDIELKAKWTPIVYNITYVTNGGTNDPSNPATYKVEDTIDFQSPTREGYTFEGWYEDEDLTTPKDGISNETGDITVYAKWEAIEEDEDIPYKVEHYKQKLDGTYEVAATETDLKGKEGETVTAKAKEYTGYKENKTHENRKASGTLMEGEDLVLKLYYDLEEYKVTFNPEGGTPTPDTQTVKYQDKATEPETKPTKEDYTFKYWYYINDNNEEVRYNFDDPVTSNIELHAKWDKNITPTPTTPDTPTTNTTTAGKTDTTVANKILPNTGIVRSVIMIVLAITVVLGVRYYRLKYIMK